jgi:hypothetical protein
MTVWRFPIQIIDEQFIEMPKVNRPLHVEVQSDVPCLWMLVEPESPRIKVRVRVFRTGSPGVRSTMDYIGTFQRNNFAYHVFFAGWEF